MIINLFGASGTGKTTLIKEVLVKKELQLLLERLLSVELSDSCDSISLSLMPSSKFRGSVETYLMLYGISLDEIDTDKEIEEFRRTVFMGDIQDLGNRPFETLSAGESRRLAILRCILEKSEVTIIDEPFANSDSSCFSDILAILSRCGLVILLTHASIDSEKHSIVNVPIEKIRSEMGLGKL